ncbi:2Fe-2S iron-sulfur cluster-binding protein [Paenibacillus filicis]|uniref:2Fe-2S iron-sulfur cluster-binding protein n=1 Tax=Paenibacillus gyeongsangnamensis TaxID=3388067 RepID=A0ABT4Q4B9_9BACL|nr:2Fe-2S iron-sulfur cluster-binding protein [Paenibacillus filicis]MCZ8511656.1 2Fe-2S iron-sulfur cluster-binding protein [Paenibacillus filicis]
MASYKVTLPDQKQFEVKEGEIILDAALSQGVDIPYTCRNGTCRTCLYQVVEGDVIQEQPELCMITGQELESGRRLLCMSTLHSDASLEKVQRKRKTG